MPGPDIVFDMAPGLWRSGDARALVQRAIEAVALAEGRRDFSGWEVGVTLTDEAAIRALNREHRGFDRPTNVLSFPLECPAPDAPRNGSPAGGLLGDIVVSGETVDREAQAAVKQPADHLIHLIVHGMLHLLGYDHESDAEATEMERLEIAILAGLGIANPYAEPHMPSSSLESLETDDA